MCYRRCIFHVHGDVNCGQGLPSLNIPVTAHSFGRDCQPQQPSQDTQWRIRGGAAPPIGIFNFFGPQFAVWRNSQVKTRPACLLNVSRSPSIRLREAI